MCFGAWAAEVVREDWKTFSKTPGPADDLATVGVRGLPMFTDYCTPGRPCIRVQRSPLIDILRARRYLGFGPLDYVLWGEGDHFTAPPDELEVVATNAFRGRLYTLHRVPGRKAPAVFAKECRQ